eukprot:CAMPEP_0195318918 /NCGR_PEP_ID=MMETSP0708-20121125/5175_1 /TAXON_ID=33640 /ORGANISM="Asterionellopsis glacialis, Strain CCMP134" /LENGTH=30 /DNA_ID= /DNA_START= /DNA_END= /DNA_ORIENTATION=
MLMGNYEGLESVKNNDRKKGTTGEGVTSIF